MSSSNGRCISRAATFSADVHDLQNFVNIALATAAGGEDDYTRDRLSNLRAMGSGYSTLIYNLPTTTSYKDLEKKCETLWDALTHYPNLPEWMVSANIIELLLVGQDIITKGGVPSCLMAISCSIFVFSFWSHS